MTRMFAIMVFFAALFDLLYGETSKMSEYRDILVRQIRGARFVVHDAQRPDPETG